MSICMLHFLNSTISIGETILFLQDYDTSFEILYDERETKISIYKILRFDISQNIKILYFTV